MGEAEGEVAAEGGQMASCRTHRSHSCRRLVQLVHLTHSLHLHRRHRSRAFMKKKDSDTHGKSGFLSDPHAP